MRGIISINGISVLTWIYYGPKGVFLTIGGYLYFGLLYYFILSNDKFYRVGTMYMRSWGKVILKQMVSME